MRRKQLSNLDTNSPSHQNLSNWSTADDGLRSGDDYETMAEIEFSAFLGDLKIQLSRDLYQALICLCQLISNQYSYMEQLFKRRPSVEVRGQ